MQEVRAQECAGQRDSGRSCPVEIPAQVLWEPEGILECLPALARWPDGSDGKSGRRQGKKWHDNATLLRAWSLSPAREALSGAPCAKFAFAQTRLRGTKLTPDTACLV
jgi:hypothetical protein